MNIPDPDTDFFPIPDPGSRGQKGTRSWIPDPASQIPDPGVKKAPDPGSGSATPALILFKKQGTVIFFGIAFYLR
jgi:hypothetical protein